MKTSISYIICSSPRSGSSFLCDGLSKTGIAGHPDEYFAPELRQRWTNQWRRDYSNREYVDKVIELSTTSNGVCGFKLFNTPGGELAYLKGLLCDWKGLSEDERSRADLIDLFRECFSEVRYIWLTRRHKIRQAVSYYRALQTDVWYISPTHKPSKAKTDQPVYSFFEIERIMSWLNLQDSLWTDFFAAAKIKPLTVVYEDIVADYENTIRDLLRHLGLHFRDHTLLPSPGLKKQANEESDLWVKRFYQEKVGAMGIAINVR
jgi:trehalose 2-sulfotransferase